MSLLSIKKIEVRVGNMVVLGEPKNLEIAVNIPQLIHFHVYFFTCQTALAEISVRGDIRRYIHVLTICRAMSNDFH
jgi:hypothetical protein